MTDQSVRSLGDSLPIEAADSPTHFLMIGLSSEILTLQTKSYFSLLMVRSQLLFFRSHKAIIYLLASSLSEKEKKEFIPQIVL